MGLQRGLRKGLPAKIRSMPVQTRKYQSECHARVRPRGLKGQGWMRAEKAPVTLLRGSLVWTEARNAEKRKQVRLLFRWPQGQQLTHLCTTQLTCLASPCL